MSKAKIAATLAVMAVYLVVFLVADNMSFQVFDDSLPASASVTAKRELPCIILDAGHGGADGGCVSYNGVPEKGINLNITLYLKSMLEAYGYEVLITRETDTSIHDEGVIGLGNQKKSDMKNRLDLFNSRENAICLSIHQNQFTDPQYGGAQMFYSETNPESEALAAALRQEFIDDLQPENNRGIKLSGSELYLIYYCENPSVMVECGFLSNPEEAQRLQTDEYQKKVAFTIFAGINNYCGAV